MLIQDGQIFNLMDTNGRRKDVINALDIYLRCLEETYQEQGNSRWETFPMSNTQFIFYQKVLENSPDTFRRHEHYDNLMQLLESRGLTDAFLNCDEMLMREMLGANYAEFCNELDNHIERRARSYTNNLVKIGFVDQNRQFTHIGRSILHNEPIVRDEIETILPIDETNLIYLRQLLKLRVYGNNGRFYAPIILAIYLLLKHPLISKSDFSKLIQSPSPYDPIENIDEFFDAYYAGEEVLYRGEDTPETFCLTRELDNEELLECFTNAKSSQSIDYYCEFYHLLWSFVSNRNQASLDDMIAFYRRHKARLNKAFGKGNKIFELPRNSNPNVDDFMEANADLDLLENTQCLNERIYYRFCYSKWLDGIHEYSDTTMRILSASGVVKFKNGLVELAFPEIFDALFQFLDIDQCAFGMGLPEDYEEGLNSFFTSSFSLITILGLEEHKEEILAELYAYYGTNDLGTLRNELSQQRQEEFKDFIATQFPKEQVIYILGLFLDRNNDSEIQELVNPVASVPTIFEYITGIAWYYLSDGEIDLLNSFNLSLNADFLPEVHAAGGEGDIVINYPEYVVMLEVTLMDPQSQKRGEWEPVLRHSVNLKAEMDPKKVVTFFIANELDLNTINIWHAVYNCELQSTQDPTKRTSKVVIMPIQINEMIEFLRDGTKANLLILEADVTYNVWDRTERNVEHDWRRLFLDCVREETQREMNT